MSHAEENEPAWPVLIRGPLLLLLPMPTPTHPSCCVAKQPVTPSHMFAQLLGSLRRGLHPLCSVLQRDRKGAACLFFWKELHAQPN